MYTLRQAQARANKLAKLKHRMFHVFLEDGYHVGDDDDADTFFYGAPIIYTVDESGYTYHQFAPEPH